MRIVVVEDEPKTREGLLNIIKEHTDYEIAGVCQDGAEGLETIRKYEPDLVITDIKMPRMDGLKMLEKLREDHVEVPVILLTGYSDFEYARKALQLQVVEYALKPLDVDEFMKTLQETEIRIEKKKIEKITADQMLWSYLSEPEDSSGQMMELLKETLKINERIQTTLFLIRPCSMATETLQEMIRSTQERMDILCMENYYIFQIPQESGYCVMVVDTEKNHNLKQIFEKRIFKELCKESPARCSMAVAMGLEDFRGIIAKLQTLLKHAFSLPIGTVIDSGLAEGMVYQRVEYPDYLEQQIIRDIRNGSREKIAEDGEKFRLKVIESEGCPECIHEYTLRFAAAILRVAGEIKGSLEQETGIPYIMNGIASSETRDEMSYQLEKIIHAVAKEEDDFVITENGMILNVINYIRENYGHDITLSDAASCCGVTPEYLSRIFSHEMGVNFTAFLQNFRVSMAKQLLYTGNHKVYEVARTVGFHDQKYFTKVFKKLCGVTPAEYKKEENIR